VTEPNVVFRKKKKLLEEATAEKEKLQEKNVILAKSIKELEVRKQELEKKT
jgi:hypothetical protein